MGGLGSGNRHHWWRPRKKTVVQDCLLLDVNRWRRADILKPGVHLAGSCLCVSRTARHGSVNYEVLTEDMARPVVRLSYTLRRLATDEKETQAYAVRLSTTRLGGRRAALVVPLPPGRGEPRAQNLARGGGRPGTEPGVNGMRN